MHKNENERWMTIAKKAVSQWRYYSYGEEVEASAMYAAWKSRDQQGNFIYMKARSAGIDELRRWTGRETSSKRKVKDLTFASSDMFDDGYLSSLATYDTESLSVVNIYNFKGRLAIIAQMLSEGETKAAVADRLGLHPSRVSQLLKDLRKEVEKSMNA
jgi:DNA-binding CsgD family transcriptional regulator